MLIEHDRIVEVRSASPLAAAEVIDATGMTSCPGSSTPIGTSGRACCGTSAPTCRWRGGRATSRSCCTSWPPAYRPEDAYIGDLTSALGATTPASDALDWSHIQGSPAHTDAVVQALRDSGLRAVFAYGFPWWGKWGGAAAQLVRARGHGALRRETRMPPGAGRARPRVHRLRGLTRPLEARTGDGARITTHVGVGSYGQDGKVQEMGEAGLLGLDTTYIHCTTLNDTEIQMIVDTARCN